MKDELKYSFRKLNDAEKKLDEGLRKAKDQLDQDGVIQRFEFTFELLWKTLKLFMADQGVITRSPKEALKEAFRFGLIKDESIFLDMLEDRNQASHIYSEDLSNKIFERIKNKYSKAFKVLLKELSKYIDKEKS
ncbi:MAG: HI0074 family nucleotidyltransferase substrate-binding subunit [Ignavibacteriaceae bacterium]